MSVRRFLSVFALVAPLVGCPSARVVVAPLPPGASTCPIDSCQRSSGDGDGDAGVDRAELAVADPSVSVCPTAGEAPCRGAPAAKCTSLALGLWSSHDDDRAVSCVARMLREACTLGDPSACGYAGRMWLDGRGVPRDAGRGMEMLVSACDGGVRLACAVAVRWLGEPAHARDLPGASDLRRHLEAEQACLTSEADACYRVGLFFYFGESSCPRDRAKAARAYQRGCDLGDARACNNLGDALAYGEGLERDVTRSAAMFDKSCRLGEALGCANSGYMFEHGQGVVPDRPRARALYRESCTSGEVYGCLHAEMLAAMDAGAPRDPERALALWTAACDRRDARACAFVGVMYVDGPDGLARDSSKSLEAMNRACGLGDQRACEWVKSHPSD